MYKNKSVLGLIPARGGSKGLPEKNIVDLCGKPLIAWSIEAGKKSRCIDRLVVSTDSEKIAATAKKHGADVPFLRPPELATDTATSFDVIAHTLRFLEEQAGERYDYLTLLEPTSPLREPEDIDRAMEQLLAQDRAESIVGVCQSEAMHPSFMVTQGKGKLLRPYEKKMRKSLRRQDLAEVFYFEGTVYISEVQALLRKKSFYHDRTLGYVVPKWKAPEIDDYLDLIVIEAILKNKTRIKRRFSRNA